MLALQRDLFAKKSASIVDELQAFECGGNPTIIESRNGVNFFFNEFWTARQRQANRIHEVSYRACFKPQLPEFFISRLTEPGDTVYDPFMGRGTTPIQAALMDRVAIGNDINPLSTILTAPRLKPPSLRRVAERLREIDWEYADDIDTKLLVFYHEKTLRQIHALRAWFELREASRSLDSVDGWIRMVAVNRLTGHSSGFFSVYTLPPNQAVSVDAQKKINLKRSQTPPERDVPAIILKKSRVLLSEAPPMRQATHSLFAGGADSTPDIPSESVNLVVTSPPFLDVVQYAADNWLRCWFVGLEAKKVPIAMYRDPSNWMAFICRVFSELARVVRRGGHVAFEVGEVRNGTIELERLVLEAARGLPFEALGVLVNVQEFTKTANCWGVNNNSKGTNTNRVVIMRRI
ncbi:MAG: M.RsaI methyltransferase [Methylocystaceae bacterium]|nr:MAG: M.RsaI methyltransferase [Methylocystaceae bacterium]KAF0211843.1 MAG: M.RsaI [Methylocystaceae bacterium]TXT44144.1 MAG: M.RsaI methyltransferase [Methylocystaceae bacterium]